MRALLVVCVSLVACKGAASANDVQSDLQNVRVAVDQWKAVRMGATACPTIADLQKDKLLTPGRVLPKIAGATSALGSISASPRSASNPRTSDPWGHPYEIVCGPEDYVVRSAGPDGIAGNADDIVAATKLGPR